MFLYNWSVVGVVLLITSDNVDLFIRAIQSLFFSGIFVAVFLFYPCLYIARFGLRFRDSQIFIISATQMGFFVTPIFWNPPDFGVLRIICEINPFSWIIYSGKQYFLMNLIEGKLISRVLVACVISIAIGAFISRRSISVKKFL